MQLVMQLMVGSGWERYMSMSAVLVQHWREYLREAVHPPWPAHFAETDRSPRLPVSAICCYRLRRLLGCSCSSLQHVGAQTMESWWPGLVLKGEGAVRVTVTVTGAVLLLTSARVVRVQLAWGTVRQTRMLNAAPNRS
jgi:hypothetical protein